MSLVEIAPVRAVRSREPSARTKPNEYASDSVRIKEGQALNFSLAVAQRY
ncbi:hypothetical protein GEV33_013126 [Tenebrio molitor]|uniref:Uncharacterized protein n=1 Tax=Tenebrio molitor TaxID=7067 RepID=A0A8J6L2X5_TENMO|nr:hypothetical protein GEV33_013126 [Tenebrio molitor]